MIVLAFDIETTGLVKNRTIRSELLPRIIEFYGQLVDLTNGEVKDELETLIKQTLPDEPAYGEKKTPTQITGITNEMLASAPQFEQVADRIINFIERAPLVAAHNLSFDIEIMNIETERISKQIRWPRGFCTVEQTVHLKGYRMDLNTLHEYLFEEKFTNAHRAKTDVTALVRCLRELYKRDLI